MPGALGRKGCDSHFFLRFAVFFGFCFRAALRAGLTGFFFFGAGILLFQPQEPRQLSQTERFLLQDENPLGEAASILDQKKAEDRNMMLIFASVGDRDVSRRYRP